VIGRTLSHYRVLEKLGAGGMGEVYRARDEKLGREVAVKVLPPGLLANEAARARFRKESEALSRLSHPHIATLLDFDTADGIDFLVMELVEGKTLLEAVREGPLSEKEVVRLGSQLARGLQAAHEHGVIHRDLKPGNLALTPDGLLKVLDFGLARLERLTLPEVGEKTASTDTAVGHVVGTPAYMAPEQLRGKGVDARTDVYGAGACLYELATGRRPFGSKSGVELTDAVLHEVPVSPRSVSGGVSPGLEAVILKCLDKDPGLRYQTAKELLVDLERLQAAATSGSASQPVAVVKSRPRWPWLVAAAALVAFATAAWLLWPPPPPRITGSRPLTAGLEADLPVDAGYASWTTDGTRLYYLSTNGAHAALFQIPATGGEAVEIPLPFARRREIHGYLPEESALLMTGSGLVCEAQSKQGRPLWIVPVPAGAPSRWGSLVATLAAVSADGRQIALVRSGAIVLVRRDGSVLRELGPLPSEPLWVQWAPSGEHLRYAATGPAGRGAWIWEIPASGGPPRALWEGAWGRWTRDGRYYVFCRGEGSPPRSDVYAVREGGNRLPWSAPGTPVRLTSGPLSFDDPGPSSDGRRLFAWGRIDRGEMLRYDAGTGRFLKYLGGVSAYYVDASADGQWLAWVSYPEGALWKSREDGTQRLRLTPEGWGVSLPRWSPDGRSIAFPGRRPGDTTSHLFRVSADGGEPELLRFVEQGTMWDACWLPDGRHIVYSHMDDGIYRMDVETRGVSRLPGSESMAYPKCSPAGDVLAMQRPAEGAALPVYWALFAGRNDWERLGDLSLTHPNWSRDGQSFVGLDTRTRRIERWSKTTRRLETVAEVGDIPLVSWVHAPWMGLAPDGSPLVVRDRSTRDLYALDWEAP
jgi:Tol biopolymer transport system component